MATYSVMTSCLGMLLIMLLAVSSSRAHNRPDLEGQIRSINSGGPYLGLLVQSKSQLEAFLGSSSFVSADCDYVDVFGRRFHLGWLVDRKVIIVMTGTGMLNAGLCAQFLVTLFTVEGIIHYGRASNANSNYNIGDIVIASQWAHTGSWYWQRVVESDEESGWYNQQIGYLDFDDFNGTQSSCNNSLNRVWYQPENIFSISGTAEVAEEVFWFNVTENYYDITEKLEEVTLEACMNSTNCLSQTPKIRKVERGCSANIYIDNKSYRNFLRTKFGVTVMDTDSAAAAMVCYSNAKPFISMRSLSSLAGEASSENEDATVFYELEMTNAITAVTEFVTLLTEEALTPVGLPVRSPIESPLKHVTFLGYEIW